MGDHSYDDITSQFIKYDNNFHKLIFRIAGKESIWDMIFGINQHYERFRALVNLYGENNVQNLYKQHCTIVEALNKKDFNTLQEHINKMDLNKNLLGFLCDRQSLICHVNRGMTFSAYK